jgi:RNA polymerase sigma factor (sigma-70 family)
MNDWDLLNQFVHTQSEDAFARLVELHAGMVYSVCRRRLHDSHLAEDATQAVFIVLAARARTLRAGSLAGWLHQTARHVAERAARHSETRLRHERKAAQRQEMTSAPPDDSHEAAEQVERMLARLGDADRSAIVLRYLECRSMIEIANAMNLSEEAAKKRVARGLDRLKKLAASGGVPAAFPAIEVALKTLNAPVPHSEIAAKSVAVAIGKAKAVQSTIFAKEVIKMIILKKLQLVTLTVLSVFVVTGSTALVITKTGDHSAVAAASPAPPATPAPAQAAPPRAPVNARNAMNRVLPAAVFDNVGLADVFDFFKDISGVPINVDWNALTEAGVSRIAPATMNLRDVTFATAMHVLLWSVAEPGNVVPE